MSSLNDESIWSTNGPVQQSLAAVRATKLVVPDEVVRQSDMFGVKYTGNMTIDSGAYKHVVVNFSLLEDVCEVEMVTVVLADGNKVTTRHKG